MRRPGFETREISRMTGSPSTYFNSILSSAMPGRTCSRLQPRMYPSRFRTSRTFARIFEAGEATTAIRACCPLRIRVSMSPKGSLMVIDSDPLPARFEHAGDLARGGQLADGDARQLELAVIAARPARHRAAVANPGRRGIARHLGQLQLCLEALLRCRLAIAGEVLKALALRRLLPSQLGAAIVLFDRAFLSHGNCDSAGDQFWNGMSKPLSKALASASVWAVVTMTISIPRTVSTRS